MNREPRQRLGRCGSSTRAGLRTRALACTAGLLLASCSAETPSVDAAPPVAAAKPVQLVPVTSETFTRTLVVSGIVEASTRIDLPFRVSGHTAELLVDEGDAVQAGQVLARLDLADLERELGLARAALDRARARASDAAADLERQRKLHATQAASDRSLERAESAFRIAEADRREAVLRVDSSADRLAKGTLAAPVAGWIEARHLEPHEFAAADAPAFVLTVLDPVTVRAAAPDASLSDLRVGTRAVVRSTTRADRPLEARVVRVGVAADPRSRTLPFEVEVANPELGLRPEMAVEVEIRRETDAVVQRIPLGAVLRDARLEPFCFVGRTAEDGLYAERRALTLGGVHGEAVSVSTGLVAGDSVVVRGQHLLREGDAIRAVGSGP